MLEGKTPVAIALFKAFVGAYRSLGAVELRPTKSMIALDAGKKILYLRYVGRDFIDIVFPFDQPYSDNLCFHKIAQVPDTNQFNHHFRMYAVDDLNEELMYFLRKTF